MENCTAIFMKSASFARAFHTEAEKSFSGTFRSVKMCPGFARHIFTSIETVVSIEVF